MTRATVSIKPFPDKTVTPPYNHEFENLESDWMARSVNDIEFKFRTEDLNGTILYALGSNKVDFFRIYLENGKLYTNGIWDQELVFWKVLKQ